MAKSEVDPFPQLTIVCETRLELCPGWPVGQLASSVLAQLGLEWVAEAMLSDALKPATG